MNIDINIVLAVIGTVFLVGSNIVWLITFYSSRAEKKAIERREFGHLKNNQQQMSQGITLVLDAVEKGFQILNRDILEIKFMLGIKDRSQDD